MDTVTARSVRQKTLQRHCSPTASQEVQNVSASRWVDLWRLTACPNQSVRLPVLA